MRYDIFNGDEYFHAIVSGRIEIDAFSMEFGDGPVANFIFPARYFGHLVVVPIE